ncbi:MAG: DUF362 domain-containing protein [Clostridia bacterium]|nr:DUF362 domain-containing protein [Clostridia bacterium]
MALFKKKTKKEAAAPAAPETAKSFVIIKNAPKCDYMNDFAALPESYGTKKYFDREDIKGIHKTVFAALDDLNAKTHFTDELKNDRPVLIKPNLVFVYHNVGLDEMSYPENTDPRVFDAVIAWLKQYTDDITIIESAGKPYPTAVAFRAAGYDRIAKYRGTGLVPLEEQPVVHYYLPKAEVMNEVYLPAILDRVVKGEAFYVSVPKMKTNLYTGVTLGFKNAMGTIPYFLRERNHTHQINKKLADLLYLFKPDLTVIDGIIGGEGNTPAPVDPVKVGKIVASNNSVEADRITTKMMGFDPEKNELMIEATRRNFGDPNVKIIGDTSVTKFRPAVTSLFDDLTAKDFPNLLAVAGHTMNDAPKITDPNAVTPEIALALEQACHGGCLAAVKTGLEYFKYSKDMKQDFKLCIIEGPGVPINGELYWFDRTGKPYTKEDLKKLPMKKYGMGDCTLSTTRDICFWKATGCCDPEKNMSLTCLAGGALLPIVSPKDPWMMPIGMGAMKVVQKRMGFILKGTHVDAPRLARDDRVFDLPQIAKDQPDANYINAPLPKMSLRERCIQLIQQPYILFAALPITVLRPKGSGFHRG